MPIPDIEIFIFPFLMSVFDITLQNAIFLTYDSGLVSLIVGLYLLDGKEWKKIKKKLKL